MVTERAGNFLTHRSWFREVITENVILCGTSALEMLEMFNGLIDEGIIDVYALSAGKYENISYHVVETFENLNIVQIGNIRCTSFEQTVNDMLSNPELEDMWALTEALSNYYEMHNESFEGLHIRPENAQAFENIRQDAIDCFCEG